jgi:hypothetical protein
VSSELNSNKTDSRTFQWGRIGTLRRRMIRSVVRGIRTDWPHDNPVSEIVKNETGNKAPRKQAILICLM